MKMHTELMKDFNPERDTLYGCGRNSALAIAVDYSVESGLFQF